MRRPYFSLFIVSMLTVAAARGGASGASGSASLAETLETALRLGVIATGGRSIHDLWRQSERAYRHAVMWAVCVLLLLSVQDMSAGYLRPGLGGRLVATALISAVLASAVWPIRVHRRPA